MIKINLKGDFRIKQEDLFNYSLEKLFFFIFPRPLYGRFLFGYKIHGKESGKHRKDTNRDIPARRHARK